MGLKSINGLLPVASIESESFDFKREASDLQIHLCAFANSVGGYIVLGVDEDTVNPKHTKGFRLYGFTMGEENDVQNKISNAMYNVDPIPQVKSLFLEDIPNNKFYVVLRIDTSDVDRPHCVKGSVKGSGTFYVRVNASSSPASRTIIFNLFSNLAQKRTDVERLRTSAYLLKESLQYTSEEIDGMDPPQDVIKRIALPNLDFLKCCFVHRLVLQRQSVVWRSYRFLFYQRWPARIS